MVSGPAKGNRLSAYQTELALWSVTPIACGSTSRKDVAAMKYIESGTSGIVKYLGYLSLLLVALHGADRVYNKKYNDCIDNALASSYSLSVAINTCVAIAK